MKKIFFFIYIITSLQIYSQEIQGIVTNEKNKPLVGANVYWINSNQGTTTNIDGFFKIKIQPSKNKLIFSYVGYTSDTISIKEFSEIIKVKLRKKQNIKEIKVTEEKSGTFISSTKTIKTEVITQKELTKSACCDLAGCFNTQSSVKATTTNIITNSKELRILGLSGVYNQILIDNMPLINGLTYTYGISNIPGTLVNTIYVSKGANSVIQGPESISGQINVLLKNPDEDEKFLFNLYTNSFLEKQLNLNYTKKIKNWKTLASFHIANPGNKIDSDNDDFLDIPLIKRYSIYNKWQYGEKEEWGLNSMVSLRYTNESRIGGQTNFNPETDKGTNNAYGNVINFSQPELYSEVEYRFNNKSELSFQSSIFSQKQESYFGTTSYRAEQNDLYSKIQYSINWKNKHNLKTGLSYKDLKIEEDILFNDSLNRSYSGEYIQEERTPGLFIENIFKWRDEKITLITGLRYDNHNIFGRFITPRGLLKYNFNEKTTARISLGSGWRTAKVFSENIRLLASSKDIIINNDIKPEQAINYGANLTHNIYGEEMNIQLTFDFYKTNFSNQIFTDYSKEPNEAYIGNFTGESSSNAFQLEIGFEFFKTIGIKTAYNYVDNYRIQEEEKINLPFTPKHRINSTISIKPLSKKWHLDINTHYYSKQNLPMTCCNPIQYQRPNKSEPYNIINAQFTYTIKNTDIYFGCENITNFRNEKQIISWENPFGQYFDTSTAWGPTKGRELYLGLRLKLK